LGAPYSSGRYDDLERVFGQPFDAKYWEQNTPFHFARLHAAEIKKLKIYFDCGDRDGYGFDAGARQLDRLLTSLGVAHEAHIYPGGHDWTYVMEHFGQSLEFQWQAIAQP